MIYIGKDDAALVKYKRLFLVIYTGGRYVSKFGHKIGIIYLYFYTLGFRVFSTLFVAFIG